MTVTPDQLAALRDIAETWPDRPAVIIGATALGFHIDILPASRSLIEEGEVEWPTGEVMSLEGMDLVFAHAVEHATADGQSVRVAPPAVVTVLKMASYLDRPAERERDLADIAHLLDLYVDEGSDRRWEEAAGIEFDLAPAFLLGRDIGRLLGSARRALVDRFIARVGDPDSSEHSRMERRGRDAWRNQTTPLRRRLDSFRQGFEDGLSRP